MHDHWADSRRSMEAYFEALVRPHRHRATIVGGPHDGHLFDVPHPPPDYVTLEHRGLEYSYPLRETDPDGVLQYVAPLTRREERK